jgi:arylsulfatase A-like enzyme
MGATYFAHLVLLHGTGALRFTSTSAFLSAGLGLVSVMLGLALVGTLFSRGRFAAQAIYLTLHVLLGSYTYSTGFSVDYAMLADNVRLASSPQTGGLIVSAVLRKLETQIFLGAQFIGLLGLGWWAFRTRARQAPKSAGSRVRRAVTWSALALVWLGLLLVPANYHDELANVVGSAWRYHFDPLDYSDEFGPNDLPMVREASTAGQEVASPLPHIFVIMIESFNARVIENTADGQPITPVFDSLIPKGLYVDRFYSHSIQSSKARFTILCSILPLIRGKVLVHHPKTQFRCLPEVLNEAGYETIFVQAYDDLGFDSTGQAMDRLGFDQALSIVPDLKPEDDEFIWGWGAEDQVFYRRMLERLDTREHQRPLFVMLATVSNHMRFNVPERRRKLFQAPSTMWERFANSIHLGDAHIQVFLDELTRRPELANSIVIITGDHSFPLGDHGIEHNEHGFYEESFRTPFLMLWPGHIKPRRIRDAPASQVDIVPTLLDLTGLMPSRHHYQGRSLVREHKAPAPPVHLVQPYNGTWLGVIDGFTKYMRREKTGEERVYDLKADPQEQHNLASDTDPAELDRLRGESEWLKKSSYLVTRDQIWRPAND